MNIKDAYIHNGDAILKDIKVENSSLKKILAGKKADDTYLGWETVCDLTGIKPNAAGTADKVGHKLTFSGGVTGTWDGSADKTVTIPTKSSWNYDDIYLKLSGGTITGPIKFSNSANSNLSNNYLSAGGGYSSNSGRLGLKLVSIDQSDIQAGIGVDLTGFTYETTISTGRRNDTTPSYITFATHNSESSSYKRLGYFKASGDTDPSVLFYVGGTVEASKFIGSLQGNASTATNADRLGNITASNYFKHRDAVFNSEWSGKYLWTLWDNHLHAADKRLAVTLTGTTSTNFSSLFDGSFESSVSITEAKAVLHIKSTTEGNVWTEGLPYGDFYVVFYNSDAENITGRVYCNYAPQGTGWHDLPITHVGPHIWKLNNGYYQLSDLEITITKPVSSTSIDLCQVLHVVERSSSPYYAAVMSKYCDQKTNYNIEAAKFIKTGGTSSQFLKADGSVDSNTYSKSNHTHSSVLDINDNNATTFAYSKSGLNYDDYTWLAGWNGYELRAVSKSQFAQASHTHTKSQIIDFPTSLPANGGYANEIASKGMLDSQEKIDNFITPNRFEYALFKTTDANNIDFASNDGMIVSIPWASDIYGFQMAFDDTKSGNVKVRGKSNSWGDWYTLLHSGNYTTYTVQKDGTGASGTWGISITGNAKTATTSTYASNVGSSGTAGTNYVTAANIISMYNWYNSITTTDDASNTAIDKWNEIVSFLAGITDTSTLSGILAGYAAAGHDHDDKYVKLDGSNVISGDLTLNLGDLDRFIVFSYLNTVNPSHDSWRTGVLGTGQGENNFFVVQYQKVNTNSSDWNTAFKIGQDTGTVTFTNNIKVGSNTVYHSGNLPAYPKVNNGALNLQASGTTKVTFYANQSGTSNFNIATGSTNGTISVGGTDVAVKGLGSNAYTSTAYLPLAGGTMDDNAQIKRNGESSMWIYGRDNALIRETSSTGYHPLFSLKTTDGSWELGEYNLSGWNNIPVFSYITDENYNNGNNSATYQIQYPLASGTIALTADLTWSNISSKPETATRWPSWSEVTNKPSTFPVSEHNHDGRYLRWNGSASDVSAMTWGTLTAANGYKILSHAASSDGGDWGMVNKDGKIYMQLDGYYYQNEGQYRVTDVSETVTALGTNGNYLTWTKNGITNNITVPYADTLDGYHAYESQLYNVVKSLTVTTVNTIWYLKIMLSPYAQPDHMLVTCSYNNEIDRAHIYFSGMSDGYIYRNNNQNEGNIKAIALKSVYDATEHIWIFYLKFDKIYNSSEQHYSPSSSATVSVYTLDNYAFNIAVETTEPNGVTWVTTGNDDNNLIIKNAKLYGSAIYADTAGSVAWDNVSNKPTFTTWSEISSAASYSLSNAAWTNTITLPTTAGSYILNIVSGNSTLTGVFSIGASDNAKDEISLHLHGNGPRLYARTNGTTLQLSSNDASATSRSVTIKYRRMI